jgi:hypothetical protein
MTQRITIIIGCIHLGVKFFVIFPIQPQKMEVSDFTSPGYATMTLIGTKHDPHATDWINIVIADFIFSNGLPISLVKCTKFNKLIQCAWHITPKYSPPYRKNGKTVAGRYLSINI